MTITEFLILLSAFSTISSLTTEAIKKLVSDKANLSYNVIALVVALIIGSIGTAIYYQFNAIPLTLNNKICMILMGFASGLVSMLSYDKIKQAILQITNKTE